MSLSTLTSIAAVRDRTAPTKAHVGKQNVRKDDKAAQASIPNMLVSSVPTELVAPYTAITAVIVGAVDQATRVNPHPSHYEGWRWFVFAVLVLGTIGVVWVGALRKGSTRKAPVLEIVTSATAAVGWGLSLPNSPLTLHLSKGERAFVPLIVAFVAVTITAALASGLREQARPRR